MPIVTIVKSGGTATSAVNRNLATILGAGAPVTGWVRNLVFQSPDTNTEAAGGVKIGNSAMTSTNYDQNLLPGDSTDDTDDRVMLNTVYLRTDEATDQTLNVRFEMT